MLDFADIPAASKKEQIRAWCIEQAILAGVGASKITSVAQEYEQYITDNQ